MTFFGLLWGIWVWSVFNQAGMDLALNDARIISILSGGHAKISVRSCELGLCVHLNEEQLHDQGLPEARGAIPRTLGQITVFPYPMMPTTKRPFGKKLWSKSLCVPILRPSYQLHCIPLHENRGIEMSRPPCSGQRMPGI